MPPDLTGRVALVTGGSKGLGRALAESFLRAGADVAVCARSAPSEPVIAGDRAALFVPADLRVPEQAAAVVDATVTRFGRLDIVVNNAGGSPPSDIAGASPRFIEKVVALNLLAPIYVAQQAHRVMAG